MGNSTLVEDYPHIDSVVINARARLEMAPVLASQQMRGDDETTVSVVAFPDGLSETGMANIPVWVMVVSIMTGLLVVVFDCGRKSAKCFTISCNLPRLKRRDFAVIKLRSRVWNSTL